MGKALHNTDDAEIQAALERGGRVAASSAAKGIVWRSFERAGGMFLMS
jgi:hypothetical protein